MARKSTAVADPEVDETEDLEELEESEATDAPAKAKAEEVTFGAKQLAEYVSKQTETSIDAKGIRVLLRKMARDGRMNREITPGNRSRYSWSGPNDPEVKAILKAVKDGELEADKQEKLAKLKEDKAAKQAEKAKITEKAKKAVAKKPAPVEDDEDDSDDDE